MKVNFFFFLRLLHSERQSISEAPAVYFVMPTEENVKKICEVIIKLLPSNKGIKILKIFL